MYTAEAIKENIKFFRMKKGMSQEELAAKIGTKRAVISKYETGIIKNIPFDRIEKIAEALGVDYLELFGMQKNHIGMYREIYSDADELKKLLSEDLVKEKYFETISESYEKLNLEGRKTAAERVEELTHIEKYKAADKKE